MRFFLFLGYRSEDPKSIFITRIAPFLDFLATSN